MSSNRPAIAVAALVIFIILCMMFTYQVRFTETVVVTRFDEIKAEEDQPQDAGLHFKWPWPIDNVHRYDTRLRSFETEFRQAATSDQNTVILTAYALWRIDDGVKFLKSVGEEDSAKAKITDLLENQVQLVLRTHPLTDLVNTDPKKTKLVDIERKFLDGIKDAAKQEYGVQIVNVGIKRLGLPESVTNDVFTRMKADREKEINRLNAEGESKAREIIAAATEKSEKILARANAYAKTLEGEGVAEAAKYYETFAKNPAFSNFLKKLEALKSILESGKTALVLDASKFFPFDIMHKTGSPDSAFAESDNTPTVAKSSEPDTDETALVRSDDDGESEE